MSMENGKNDNWRGRAKFSQEVLLQYHFSCYKFRMDCPELKTHPSVVENRGLFSGRKFRVTWSSHSDCTKLMRKMPSNFIGFYFSRKSPE
jgi:hypothetical protein